MEGVTSLLLIRGILGVAIGVIAIVWPGITLAVLVGIFAVYAILDGITNLFVGMRKSPQGGRSWAQIVQGLVGVAAGIMTVLWPAITALALVWFIAAWAVVTGALEIAAAIRLRRVITGEWMLVLSGILSVVFGILVFAFPAAGAVGISWILGIYAAAAGFVLIALAMRLRTQAPAIA
jgi:uncharacterized membrane protein HdeD (DUF308 family)